MNRQIPKFYIASSGGVHYGYMYQRHKESITLLIRAPGDKCLLIRPAFKDSVIVDNAYRIFIKCLDDDNKQLEYCFKERK